jgi:AcrR family transcriptional regulator
MIPEKRGRGRPRREGADDKILDATRDVLREVGYAALTVDAIAERAGVAKTTIYRRWPTKGALVAAAIAALPDAATNDVAAILTETSSILTLLADIDADGIDVIRTVVTPRRARLHEALGDALGADMLLGALLTRALIAREPVPDELVQQLLGKL